MKKSNAGLSGGGPLLTKVGPVHVVALERLAGGLTRALTRLEAPHEVTG
jgi:hypothetical protein